MTSTTSSTVIVAVTILFYKERESKRENKREKEREKEQERDTGIGMAVILQWKILVVGVLKGQVSGRNAEF